MASHLDINLQRRPAVLPANRRRGVVVPLRRAPIDSWARHDAGRWGVIALLLAGGVALWWVLR